MSPWPRPLRLGGRAAAGTGPLLQLFLRLGAVSLPGFWPRISPQSDSKSFHSSVPQAWFFSLWAKPKCLGRGRGACNYWGTE